MKITTLSKFVFQSLYTILVRWFILRSIFDFNHNSESAHEKLFREKGSIDPVPKISQAAAEKMLGRQYSGYYYFRGLAGGQGPLDVTANDVFGKVIVRMIRVVKEGAIEGGKSDEGSSMFVVPPPTATETDDGPGSDRLGKEQDTAAVEVSSSKEHARSKYLSAEEIRVDSEYDAQLASARAAIATHMAKVCVHTLGPVIRVGMTATTTLEGGDAAASGRD